MSDPQAHLGPQPVTTFTQLPIDPRLHQNRPTRPAGGAKRQWKRNTQPTDPRRQKRRTSDGSSQFLAPQQQPGPPAGAKAHPRKYYKKKGRRPTVRPTTPRTAPHAPFNDNSYLLRDNYDRTGAKLPIFTPGRATPAGLGGRSHSSAKDLPFMLNGTPLDPYGTHAGFHIPVDTDDDSDSDIEALPTTKLLQQKDKQISQLQGEKEQMQGEITALRQALEGYQTQVSTVDEASTGAEEDHSAVAAAAMCIS